MSRIRSIHPGLWTDEAFVSLSAFARLLFMGIWNECDDLGSFDWSPLKLKMRLLPADAVDAASLLDELTAAGCVMKYEHGGKAYGAVRNFCQYQRPKKPNPTYPQNDEVRKWVNTEARSTRDGGEVVGNQSPTGGEKSRQMEDGGGNRSSVSNDTDAEAVVVDPEKVMFDAGVALITSCGKSEAAARSWLGKAKRDHGAELVITMIGRAKREGAPDPIAFMEGGFRAKARASPSLGMPVC